MSDDMQKIGTEDYVVRFDDCSFKEPTCLMADLDLTQD